jgi:cysteine desulfurase
MAAYLDHNATAPMVPEVAAAVSAALVEVGNPSSVHGFGRRAKQRVDAARVSVASLVGVAPEQVVFTGSGTEAAALAIGGVGVERVLVSAVEHAAVQRAHPAPVTIPVDGDGIVDLARLEALLQEPAGRTLISVMLANNETGVIQPVAAVAALAKRYNALVHTDAVQAVGRIPVRFAELGVDLMSLSAHKIGGPQGVGALIVGPTLPLQPILRGGGQERGRRAGTEPVPAIVGFGHAAAHAAVHLDRAGAIAYLRDEMELAALRRCPDAVVIARGVPRLPNTSCLAHPGARAETLVMALDLAGYAVSAGAACSSGTVRVSGVLTAMGVAPDLAAGAIRISLGPQTTAAEVAGFVEAWAAIVARTSRRQAA